MEKDEVPSGEAVEAMDLATLLLQVCEKSGLPPHVYQAALGGAWVKICSHMDYHPEGFQHMALMLIFEYRTLWKKIHEDSLGEDNTENSKPCSPTQD